MTLASLAAQQHPFSLIIADQSDEPVESNEAIANLLRILRFRGHSIRILSNPIRRGVAQQRELLFQASSDVTLLFLDDDVWLGPGALGILDQALAKLECGFVGMPLIGLTYIDDVRPAEQRHLEFWEDKPTPEVVLPGSKEWQRYELHNAANPVHLNASLHPETWKAYKVAWIGGCTLYQRRALDEVGAWSFWSQLPSEHAGEDVAVQLKIMARRGGAGILPSLAFHQQVPTTIPQRDVQAYL